MQCHSLILESDTASSRITLNWTDSLLLFFACEGRGEEHRHTCRKKNEHPEKKKWHGNVRKYTKTKTISLLQQQQQKMTLDI